MSMQSNDIFLIHGWCANNDCWQKIATRLSGRYRLTMAELPGHGQNIGGHYSLAEPETLIEHWLTIAPPNAVWIGWSLGGLLAQLAASRAPNQVRKLISLCMGMRFAQGADWPFGTSLSAIRNMNAALHKNPSQCLSAFIKQQASGDQHERQLLPWLQNMIDTPFELEELDAGLRLLETMDMRDSANRLTMPTLFIAGVGDRISKKESLQASAKLCPQGQYIGLAEAGHAALLSHPDVLIDQIDDFLQY